jgi:large conductance mechanosensitive channel
MQKQSFFDFIREQGVVGLAIGFILGGATNGLVQSLVADIIDPLIGLLFPQQGSLSDFMIGPVAMGNFFASLIDFVVLAAVVYFVFRGLRLEKLDKKKA